MSWKSRAYCNLHRDRGNKNERKIIDLSIRLFELSLQTCRCALFVAFCVCVYNVFERCMHTPANECLIYRPTNVCRNNFCAHWRTSDETIEAKSICYTTAKLWNLYLARKTPAEIVSASLSQPHFAWWSEKRQLSTEIFGTSSEAKQSRAQQIDAMHLEFHSALDRHWPVHVNVNGFYFGNVNETTTIQRNINMRANSEAKRNLFAAQHSCQTSGACVYLCII